MQSNTSSTITLYRSNSKSQEADELRAFLSTTHYPFVEKNVSDDPDYHSKLIKQFGGQLSFPGIRVNDQFVSMEHGDLDRLRAHGDYWLEELLMGNDEASCGSSGSEHNNKRQSPNLIGKTSNNRLAQAPTDWPQPKPTHSQTKSDDAELVLPHRKMRALSLGSANTGLSELSSASSVFRDFHLPGGETLTPAEMTRKLLPVIQHSVVQYNGKLWYYFRGDHAVEVVKELFFEDSAVKEEAVVSLAIQLVERGIFVDWTPECNDFRSTFLVMYHYSQPNVINTLLKWPSDEHADDDPVNVILRLSRDMDEICIWENYQRKDKAFAALYKSLEEKICQLQVIQFPLDPMEHVTFALNLYNLIIRHAMIMAPKRQWRWPSNLEEFEAFTHQIGYDIGGEIATLAYLRESLYGTKGLEPVPLVACKPSLWERFSCRGDSSELRDLHYERSMIRTDPRLIFATTWGCHSSPTASTVYPYQLSEGLRTAAEMFCQQHVVITGNRIILPTLLSWYRADFGTNPENVVKAISRFLADEKLAHVLELTKQGVPIEVVFDEHFDWQPGIAAPSKEIEFQFASKDFPSTALPAFACENTVASRASRVSLVSRLSKLMPSVPLFGRQSSDGESEVKPRLRETPRSRGNDTDHDESVGEDHYYYDDEDDDDTTHGPSTIVSALTLGSEFGDIRFQAERSKKSYHRLSMPNAAPPQQSVGGNLGYGYGQGGLY